MKWGSCSAGVVDYINGFALAEASGRIGQPGEPEELVSCLDQPPPEQAGTLRLVYEDVAIDEIVSDVDSGLDIILAGIEALKNKWGTVPAE